MRNEFLNAFWPACLFAVVLMIVIWRLALRINNMGIVDIAWSLGFAPVALFYAATTSGFPLRRGVIAGMAVVWSLRLGLHLYVRVMGHHPVEDVRYAELRAKWGANLQTQALIFFQLQAVLIALLSVPFLISCLNRRSQLCTPEWLGLVIWFMGIAGEALADWQLKQFKANPANRGRVCQAGLWNYSRHPNYFFEWLVWVGFYAFACGSRGGWLTIYCPALMLFFLLRVTGIPMTEALSVKSKGDQYREYQRTTSGFVPWLKKS